MDIIHSAAILIKPVCHNCNNNINSIIQPEISHHTPKCTCESEEIEEFSEVSAICSRTTALKTDFAIAAFAEFAAFSHFGGFFPHSRRSSTPIGTAAVCSRNSAAQAPFQRQPPSRLPPQNDNSAASAELLARHFGGTTATINKKDLPSSKPF